MRVEVRTGDTIRVRLPWSEVCAHLRVAGELRKVRVLAHGAQVLDADGSDFSFPVTHGEAGIFTDRSGFYVIGEGE